MSKPERGSLTTLLAKKPLGQGAPPAVPLEQAETALMGAGGEAMSLQPSVEEDVQPDVRIGVRQAQPHDSRESTERTDERMYAQPDVQPTRLLSRDRRRTVRVPWTFKLPYELREELEAVARFNDLNMTEIAVEAIERHLKHFPHPPASTRRGDG